MDEIRVGLAGRHPALDYDAVRAHDCEPVACERGRGGLAGQLAVRAAVADEASRSDGRDLRSKPDVVA